MRTDRRTWQPTKIAAVELSEGTWVEALVASAILALSHQIALPHRRPKRDR